MLYLAFGDKYVAEAKRSIASLRIVSPRLPVAVITDCPWGTDLAPDYLVQRPLVRGYECKLTYLPESPFDSTLYIDTDTFIARDLTPVFGMLNYYDIGVRFHGSQLNESSGLEFHMQCNSGVVLYKKCDAVAEVFHLWRETFKQA